MSELATYTLSPIFRNFRTKVEQLRDVILVQGGTILKREEQASIRQRWYDTGATLASLESQIVEDGNTKSYLLFPTAVSKRGAPYPLFGEYGTGRAGSSSGRPAPRGYRYGDSKGMTARRYSRIAVGIARPQVAAMAVERTQRFAANMTS